MTTYAASDKQLAFIKRLVAERDITSMGPGFAAVVLSPKDSRDASNTITDLLNLPKKPQAVAAVREALTDGMYMKDGDIYKVQYNRASGDGRRLYAKLLVVHSSEFGSADVHFEYAPGAIHQLSLADRMSLEDARAFGVLYGTCCVCGRTLTDEVSIENGIGPVCAGKYF